MPRRKRVPQKRQQLTHLLRKIIQHPRLPLPLQRQRLHRPTTRSPPNPQVHASRIQRMQRPKTLRHLQRRVVRQHDPTRPNPNPLRLRPNPRQHHLRSRTRQRIHRMVFRHPEPRIPQPIHQPRQLNRVLQSLPRRTSRRHRRLVQHRQPQSTIQLIVPHIDWMCSSLSPDHIRTVYSRSDDQPSGNLTTCLHSRAARRSNSQHSTAPSTKISSAVKLDLPPGSPTSTRKE